MTAKATLTSPVALAVNVYVPGVVPRVHDPTVAIPAALLNAAAPVRAPPPAVVTNATLTPATGLPNASTTMTLGDGVTADPTTPVSGTTPLFRWSGGPAEPVA